jgi:hypothetical protein
MLISLSGEWTLKGGGHVLTGNVPGDVSDDLMRGGYIKDPYYFDNWKDSQWVTHEEWCYERTFHVHLSDLDENTYGIKVIALVGDSSCAMDEWSDVTIHVPKHETFQVQELHLPVYHYLCAACESAFFKE